MKFLNELLGFAVLTGPLWLILILLPIAVWIAVIAAKRFEWRSAKIGVGLMVFLLVFFVPFADELAGRFYLSYLCAKEAGVKIHKTAELPAEYWQADGRPNFFNKYGYLEREFWVKELDESGGHISRHSTILSIDKDIKPVRLRSGGEMLAEIITFRYWGGWMRRNFSPHNTANSCKFLSDPNFSRNFYGQLFKPVISSK